MSAICTAIYLFSLIPLSTTLLLIRFNHMLMDIFSKCTMSCTAKIDYDILVGKEVIFSISEHLTPPKYKKLQ